MKKSRKILDQPVSPAVMVGEEIVTERYIYFRCQERPVLILDDPYGRGWMFKIKPEKKKEGRISILCKNYNIKIKCYGISSGKVLEFDL